MSCPGSSHRVGEVWVAVLPELCALDRPVAPGLNQRQDVAPSRCRTTLRRRVGDASTS